MFTEIRKRRTFSPNAENTMPLSSGKAVGEINQDAENLTIGHQSSRESGLTLIRSRDVQDMVEKCSLKWTCPDSKAYILYRDRAPVFATEKRFDRYKEILMKPAVKCKCF